jgi:hypothetical protein
MNFVIFLEVSGRRKRKKGKGSHHRHCPLLIEISVPDTCTTTNNAPMVSTPFSIRIARKNELDDGEYNQWL